MNYISTFIEVAADSKAEAGTPPIPKAGKRTVAVIEYELITTSPYKLTQEDVQFAVHVERAGIAVKDLKSRRDDLWKEFFAKPMACMRTSPLAKTYGWGLHFDKRGRVGLVGVETERYAELAKDKSLNHTRAMASARKAK